MAPIARPTHPVRLPAICLAAVTSLALLPQVAPAQNRSIMIMDRDDGEGTETMSFTLPDMHTLRKPEYIRDDLPTFRNTLYLSDPQHAVVTDRLTAYLDAFKTLLDEYREATKGSSIMMFDEPMMFENNGMLGGEGEGDGESLGDILSEAFGRGGDTNVDIMPGGMMMIGVTADAGGPGGPGFGPGAGAEPGEGESVVVFATAGEEGEDGAAGSVRIAVASEDGEMEIPPEVLEKLKAKAEEMAKQLEERMAEAEAEGNDMPFGHEMDMDAHREQMEALAAAAAELETKKKKLGVDFIQDVQLQLSQDQMDRWPRLERALTRRKTLPLGRLDGESTDLIKLAEQVVEDDTAREDLNEELETYAVELDGALRRRNEYLETSQKKLDGAISAGDMDAAIVIADRAARLRVAVREVNSRHSETIAIALNDAQGEAFRAAALKRAHPRIYRRTIGTRAFEKAAAIEDLDPNVAAAVAELQIEYETELSYINESIRRAVLEHQPDEPKGHLEMMRDGMDGGFVNIGGGHEDDPVRDAYKRRRALDRKFVKRLASTLGPEYEAMIPTQPAKRQPVVIEVGGPS